VTQAKPNLDLTRFWEKSSCISFRPLPNFGGKTMAKTLLGIVLAFLFVPLPCSGQKRVPLKLVKETNEDSKIVRVYATDELWSGHGKEFSDWYIATLPASPDGYTLFTQMFDLVGDRKCTGGEQGVLGQTGPITFGANMNTSKPDGKIVANQQVGPFKVSIEYTNVFVGTGAWSECKYYDRNDKTVTWAFRMQGHDERKKLVVDSWQISPGASITFRIEGDAATSVGTIYATYQKALPSNANPPAK
jgi:hypothetical protein